MELFSAEFMAALAAIVVIDLVLAGDNAIVIALAARGLPPRLRRAAVLWGTAGAVAVRALMTLVVVWLLKIPGLLFFGGLLLIWIAYRLLVPKESAAGSNDGTHAASFWGAMGTIIAADAMMGLDNVLAVAGAAHGSYLLVVLGLLISIPIVVWGSQLVLRLVDRFPLVIHLGAAVLVFTAATMMAAEPAIKQILAGQDDRVAMICLVLVAGVLVMAALRNRLRRQDRLAAKLEPRDDGYARVVFPIDGSREADAALARFVERLGTDRRPEVHLVNVQAPIGNYVTRFLPLREVKGFQQGEARQSLARAVAMLESRGIPHSTHVRIGDTAREIARLAERLGSNRIVLGVARRNSFARLAQDEVTSRMLRFTHVPVEMIQALGPAPLERLGHLAGLSACIAALVLALD